MEYDDFTFDPIIFEKPKRIKKPYSWVGHIPFAFYLVKHHKPSTIVELGTHTGNSYFAFCQIVDHLKLPTRCYAVDTWEGDEHAGFYGDSVYEDVSKYNNTNYSGFSTLLRKTFDKALADFEDRSIDLLHIDGLHTYEAVKHDFESWLPKMSERGIVLFHDTAVRKDDFGVWKLWEELKQLHSGFAFDHSNGLGVLNLQEKASLSFSRIEKQSTTYHSKELFKLLDQKYSTWEKKNLFAKLYYKTAESEKFQEKNSIELPVNSYTRILNFNLARFQDLRQIRIDPLNQICRVKIKDIHVVHEDNRKSKIDFSYSNHAYVDKSENLIFFTADPQLIIDAGTELLKNSKAITVEINYFSIGEDLIKELFASLDTKSFPALEYVIDRINTQEFLAKSLQKTTNENSWKIAELTQKVIDYQSYINNSLEEIFSQQKIQKEKFDVLNQNLEAQHKTQEEKFEALNRMLETQQKTQKEKLEALNRKFEALLKTHKEKFEALNKQLEAQKKTQRAIQSNLKRDFTLAHSGINRLNRPFNIRDFLVRRSKTYRLISKSEFFDECYYLENNPGVIKSGIDPIVHFIRYGWSEGRNPSREFSVQLYLQFNEDVQKKGINPLFHFIKYGIKEQRNPIPVQLKAEDSKHSLYAKQEISHSNRLKSENTSINLKMLLLDPVVFDWKYYVNHNKDVAAYSGGEKKKAEQHWLNFGIKEGRIAAPTFNLNFYKQQNNDVQKYANGDNKKVIAHFLLLGIKEGRQGFYVKSSISNLGPFHFIRGYLPIKDYKKNIVLVAHNASNRIYGGERSFIDICHGINKARFNIYVILPRNSKSFVDLLKPTVSEIAVCSYKWWNKENEENEDYINKFRSIYRQYHADLVHVNTILVQDAVIAARKENIPCISHIREIISKDEALEKLIGLSNENIIQKIIGNSDYIVANSQLTQDEFFNPGKTFKVLNTVNESLFSLPLPLPNNSLKVGIISSNIPKKGIRDFVHLADVVYNQHNQSIEFLLIGEQTQLIEQILEDQYKGIHSPQIKFLGYYSNTLDAIKELDVVVNFSLFAESFGRTIAEGMAAGRPVIGYDWGALPEWINHEKNGYLIPYQKPLEAIPYLLYLQNNPRLVQKLGANGRKTALDKFHPQTFAKSLQSIYDDILSKSNESILDVKDVASIHTDKTKNNFVFTRKRKTLKLAYFLWHFPVPSETFVLNELKFLKKLGIDVQVFCKEVPYLDFEPDFEIKYTRVRTLDAFKLKLREAGIEHIHSHFTYPTVTNFVWPACTELNLTFSFIAHAQDIFRYENMKFNRINEVVESQYCLKLFLPGTYHRNFLLRQNVSLAKISINPQAVDTESFIFKQKNSFTRQICAIGRFVEKKGFEFLIMAGKYLETYDITINIFGYGELEEFYQKIIDEEGINNVFILGKLNYSNEYLKALHEHDMIIQPSIACQNGDMDGVPTVLMEAMASGTIAVSTRIASIPDLISDETNGFLLDSVEPSRIADKILSIYNFNLQEINIIAENGKKKINRLYNIDNNVNHLLDIWTGYQIDIILVTYINEKHPNLPELKEVISRIYTYTTLPFNLFVIDNGSNQETLDYLKDLDQKHSNLHFHPQDDNLFVGGGTNIGLENGNADYAFYICAVEGFILANGWEIDAIAYLRANPRVGLAGTLGFSPNYLTGKEYPTGIPKFEYFRNKVFAENNPDRNFFHVQGGLVAIRRAMFREIGGFNPKIPHQYTDVEYSYYAESCGWELGEIPSFLALYEKTIPGLASRIDENRKIIHPGLLGQSELYHRIATKTIKLCNICEWTGNEFGDLNLCCPNCSSTPEDRAVYRYLAESNLTYRRLPSFCINISECLLPFWKKSFQGRQLHLKEAQLEFAKSGQFNQATNGTHIIFIKGETPIDNEIAVDLFRLLSPSGILISLSTGDMPVIKMNPSQLQRLGIKMNQFQYESTVISFPTKPSISIIQKKN